MNKSQKKIVYWSPRVLCILFALFISMFALDVFEEGRSAGQTILALLIHLIPTYIVIIVSVISWRWEWAGALAFNLFAILYIATSWGRFHWTAYAFIAGPMFLIGILFCIGWLYRSDLKSDAQSA